MQNLNQIFLARCDRAIEVMKSATPIDTQRLHDSTRRQIQFASKDRVVVHLIQGGEARVGSLKEQDIEKDVDYAIYVEMTQSYLRGALGEMAEVLGD